MGNELKRIILAPSIAWPEVVGYARTLRAARCPAVLTYRTLEDSRPRRPELRVAQQAGVRVLDLDTWAKTDNLLAPANETFRQGNYVYRHVDDEGADECIPGSDWLQSAFGTTGLHWLLEPEEQPVPWKSTTLYSIPQNPPEWDVEFPFSLALLQVFTPGQPVSCPQCGVSFVPKRQRTQCPNEPVLTEIELFESSADALRVVTVPLDAWGCGRCPRCRRASQFTRRFEQCRRCGQIMSGEPGKHKVPLIDNDAELRTIETAAKPPL